MFEYSLNTLRVCEDVSTVSGSCTKSPMNKFEQVSSDGHQISLEEGSSPFPVPGGGGQG